MKDCQYRTCEAFGENRCVIFVNADECSHNPQVVLKRYEDKPVEVHHMSQFRDLEAKFLANEAWRLIPTYMRAEVRNYVLRGEPTNSFLTAILKNDLKACVEFADSLLQTRIFDFVKFLEEAAPIAGWGNAENYRYWREIGGMFGHIGKITKEVRKAHVGSHS